jgi:ABC-type arginine transport system ATPase subunit
MIVGRLLMLALGVVFWSYAVWPHLRVIRLMKER